jgi:hypothetical protein
MPPFNDLHSALAIAGTCRQSRSETPLLAFTESTIILNETWLFGKGYMNIAVRHDIINNVEIHCAVHVHLGHYSRFIMREGAIRLFLENIFHLRNLQTLHFRVSIHLTGVDTSPERVVTRGKAAAEAKIQAIVNDARARFRRAVVTVSSAFND